MNIFLPYENDIQKSVQSLDDLRLNKQILECYQLLSNAIKEKNGENIKGYKNHPIYVHYKNTPYFLSLYGIACCDEYRYRFNKHHKLYDSIITANHKAMGITYLEKEMKGEKFDTFKYIPFYMEGSKSQPNYIRTYDNVSELYQKKLINKWQNDKRQPKWTNREIPSFYKKYLDLIGE